MLANARYGATSTYWPRLGQGIFRVQMLDAYLRLSITYQRACAVTRQRSLVVLEAAHVRAYLWGSRLMS